ncbi:MAG: hypothetical protein WA383_04825 [Terriglobales bacterium]
MGIALLASPVRTLAQRGGGGGHGMPAGAGAGVGIASGVSDKDDLKDFHPAMAVQATDEQRAAFAKIAQYTQAASDRLKAFRDLLQKVPASSPLSDRATNLDQAVEQARVSNKNFLASFSSKQKSGLKDIAKKLEKADSDLDKEVKALDQIVQIVQTSKSDTESIASSAASLDKELASFQEEQLALGREMGILLSTGSQDLTFNLPKVTNSINIAGQPVSIQASGAVSRQSTGTPAENGRNLFTLKLTADLSDVQQNITVILRSKLTRAPRCGERLEIQQATLTPLAPASLVVARVHLERWVCPPGQESPMEVAGGDGTIEVKLTPSVEQKAGLVLISEITRVDAERFLRDLLRSGDLGDMLRQQIAASVLSTLRKGTDLKATLPPAAQQSATLQKAQFQDAGADQLSLLLEGQLQLSDEQTQQFVAQLKQPQSAQAKPAP